MGSKWRKNAATFPFQEAAGLHSEYREGVSVMAFLFLGGIYKKKTSSAATLLEVLSHGKCIDRYQ